MESQTFEDDLQSKCLLIDPSKITVRDSLPRYRKDLGSLEDLAKSIREKGQIQPVLINKDYELIAGGRRLAACLLGGLQVKVVFSDSIDDLTMRELEVEENVQRKPFTPAEEVLAVDELHKLKQAKYGTSAPGRIGGWGLDKTAEIIGKTRSAVVDDIKLAEAVRMFPELSEAKTKQEIRKAVRTMEDLNKRSIASVEYDKVMEKTKLPISFDLCKAEEQMPLIPDNSIDILLTDPPYGMDVFNNSSTFLSKTFGNAGFKYDDDKDKALVLYQLLAKESFRFCKETSHAYVFCCPEHFDRIRSYFLAAGWLCHIRPMIWIKKSSGQNNAPFHWPSSCYEMILYARRKDSVLIKPGLADWVQHPPVSDTERVHQAQKPVVLLRDLISRSVYPNSILYDPFCGSAATLEAGLEERLVVKGCEMLKEAYDAGRTQIIKYQQRKDGKE